MRRISKKIDKKVANLTVSELRSIAKDLNISSYFKKNKQELVGEILKPEYKEDLKKKLNLTWWDRHNVHVYGIISIVAFLFALYVFFSSNPNLIEIINNDINKERTFTLLKDINKSLNDYNYQYNNSSPNTLESITNHYEENNDKKAKQLIEDYFFVEIEDKDQYLGYIVTSYFGNENYKKAAETVLLRNRNKKRWDFSLKLDFANCIYNYTQSNTIIEGFQLIDSLKKVYNEPIISYLWTCIPYEMMNEIETSIYTYKLYEIKDKNLKYIMDNYPEDPFIYYGYYLQGDYQRAIESKDCRIKDLCLFAYSYEIIKEVNLKYNAKNIDMHFFIPDKPIKHEKDISKIESAIEKLKEYVRSFPKQQQADDAAFWIAWLNNFLGDYYETFCWLYYSHEVGNQDYYWNYFKEFSNEMLKTVSIPNNIMAKIFELESNNNRLKIENNVIENQKLIWSYLETMSYDELSNYISQNSFNSISSYLFNLLENENFEKALFIYSRSLNKIVVNEENKQYIDFLNFIESTEKDFDELLYYIWYNKEIVYNRKLALSQIDYALSFSNILDNENIEYLHYLKTRLLVILNPSIVESFVNNFAKKYPYSIYADDVLAELIQVFLVVFNDHDKAIKYLNILLENYPKANACDNAINELAKYYFYFLDPYSENCKSNCKNLIDLNNLIIKNYPFSSYTKDAKKRNDYVKSFLENL